ncbi:MAG: RdgB/HAM1 family non-canonical purine NTP pyrophosphatase [Gemmatimonadota bacterium]|nr:RdgB/HAM1 family non-canonical purine NTP pyrophosphatase [Gemmatimonadota bacterium]MDP6803323.1 RdgB/HAM1 family non-canonical purine NTP pyrophosphatase [Gemmatimonadota bacterium]MDP7032330.1 RdgB/HAM1 family non-canonical purine NTP pyrophosphatase [Gemmatimonadota bacterium]
MSSGASGEVRVVLATRNPHKVGEFAELLRGFGVTVVPLSEFPGAGDVVEDRPTFHGNAAKKAEAAAAATGLPALADDSGLEVDALGGAPGVRSARFAGVDADDAANRRHLVECMADVPDGDRDARFRCVLALAMPDGETRFAEGACEGRILREERGSGGFGYDPLFVPAGETRTFAEMASTDKDARSHRGQAVRRAGSLFEGLKAAGPRGQGRGAA